MELIKVEEDTLEQIRREAYQAASEVCEAAKLRAGDLFVVGCSTSEVLGEKIGTHSSLDAAGALFAGIHQALQERGIWLAAQCCEHLGRALIVERLLRHDGLPGIYRPRCGRDPAAERPRRH